MNNDLHFRIVYRHCILKVWRVNGKDWGSYIMRYESAKYRDGGVPYHIQDEVLDAIKIYNETSTYAGMPILEFLEKMLGVKKWEDD